MEKLHGTRVFARTPTNAYVELCNAKLQDKKVQRIFLSGMEAAAPKAVTGRRSAEKAKGVNYDY
ncbi:MAG: hypothetical protein LBK27_00215 [Treponema sp.]|nr:hypothetical protein [Treponema sp.]